MPVSCTCANKFVPHRIGCMHLGYECVRRGRLLSRVCRTDAASLCGLFAASTAAPQMHGELQQSPRFGLFSLGELIA
eukprot:scaffold1463_cov101-Skeletonema_dohrnii-CCMP3373.AAC.2